MNRYTVFGITILVGFLAAVYYGWAVRPVSVHDATPALLREDFRADYTLMVAEAFTVDGDPERAISALSFLAVEGEPYNPYGFVADALLFGTEEGYSVTDLAALQALETGLREYDPKFRRHAHAMIKQPERRPPLYLVTGLVMGLVLGLIIAWLLWPPRVVDVGPDSLHPSFQEQYRLQVALAYASSQDLGRAQARIALLQDGDPVRALVSQAQLALANSATQREARALAGLADALEVFLASQQATAAAVDTPNSGDASQISTPFEAVAEGATYFLDSQELICESAETPPMVKIFVFDANHNPQAGVLLTMSSEEGEAEFSTGLHPEMSPGYAEYVMTPRVQYSLSILGVQMMGGLQAAACETEAGEPAWGSWLLLFNAEE